VCVFVTILLGFGVSTFKASALGKLNSFEVMMSSYLVLVSLTSFSSAGSYDGQTAGVVVEMVEMTFLLASSSAASCNQMPLYSLVRSLVHQQHIH
jgi:hypothetical protein